MDQLGQNTYVILLDSSLKTWSCNSAQVFSEDLILNLLMNITCIPISDHMQYRSVSQIPNASVPHIATQGSFAFKYRITVLISAYKYITSHSIMLALSWLRHCCNSVKCWWRSKCYSISLHSRLQPGLGNIRKLCCLEADAQVLF